MSRSSSQANSEIWPVRALRFFVSLWPLRSIVLFSCDAGNMKLNRNTSRPIIRFPSERINILTHFAQDVGFVARKVGPFVALKRLRMVWHACITVMSFFLPEPPLPLSSGTR